jgi:tetratricopeptide (TPR) repeat protein
MNATNAIKAVHIIFAGIVAIFVFSCQNQAKKDEILFTRVERLLEQHPDSALTLLHAITDPEMLRPGQFNRFLLLEIQAKDKSNRDIAADTLIFGVKDYYIKSKQARPAAMATYYCGRVLYEQGHMEEATRAYLEAERLAAKTTVTNLKGLIQGNLCIIYLEQELLDDAIARGKNAIALFHAAGNHKNEISAILRIANCFLYNEEADSTLYYCRKGVALADSYQIAEQQVATRIGTAVTLLERGNHALAKLFLQEALALSKKEDDARAKIFLNMAKVFHAEQQADSALYYIGQSRAVGDNDPYFLASLWELKAQVEEETGQSTEALASYSKYMDYVFETFDDDRSAAVLDIQKKYDYERIKNEAGRRVIRTQYTAILLLCLLVLALIGTSYLFHRAARSHKKALQAEDRVKSLLVLLGPDNGQTIRSRVRYQFGIMKETILFEDTLTPEERTKGEKLTRKFYKIVFGEELSAREKLFQTLDELQGGFYDWLHEQYPFLSEDELHLCCLSYEKMRDADIAYILDTSETMVQRRRSDIRRKVNIPPRGDLHAFFSKQFDKKNLSKTGKKLSERT